jgi:hypothetical protein
MKKEKKQVAKLEKKAKVDSKKVLITNEMAENYMRDKIKKKKGRPKKVSEDFNPLNFNPQLADLKRITKTMKKATLDDIGNYVGTHLEMSYPILEQVIEKEYFADLIQNPNAKEILSSKNVKTLLAEMIKEYTDFTMDFLNKISDNKTSLSELNTNGEVLNRISQLKEKYNPKLVSQIELYKASINPKKEFNRIVTEYLTDEDFTQPSEEALEKINEVDCSEMKTTSRWRPEFLAQVKPIEIPKKLEHLIVPTVENEVDISENPKEEHLDLFSLSITNKSDEKIHKVKIFNYDFKEQKEIKYENLEGMSYSEFLRKLDKVESEKYTIKKIRLAAVSNYKKFQDKQLEAKLYYKNKNIFARELTILIQLCFYYSPEQEHDNIIDIKKSFILYSNSEFELEYLMPDTTVNLYFFLTKNKTK